MKRLLSTLNRWYDVFLNATFHAIGFFFCLLFWLMVVGAVTLAAAHLLFEGGVP